MRTRGTDMQQIRSSAVCNLLPRRQSFQQVLVFLNKGEDEGMTTCHSAS